LHDPLREGLVVVAVGGGIHRTQTREPLDDTLGVRTFGDRVRIRGIERVARLRVPEALADAVLREIDRTGGGAFVLFTSYAMLRVVRERVRAALSYPLLVQGDAPRRVLLDQFRSTPNAVLLATSSFWQGVDVVGEALSCVVIDKLPFASPGDPLMMARLEFIRRQGGNGFTGHQLPLAVLALKQGAGRLLRDESDYGVIVLCDPRVTTKHYGKMFLDALQPMPATGALDDVQAFFARHEAGGERQTG